MRVTRGRGGAAWRTACAGCSPPAASRHSTYTMDRAVTVTYPGGEVITPTCAAQGLPQTLTGARPGYLRMRGRYTLSPSSPSAVACTGPCSALLP